MTEPDAQAPQVDAPPQKTEAKPPKKRRQPEQQAPPVMRVRVQYAKRGPARFTSHRDVGRALERALRRADVPMAYSSGFNPHPRISYANAAPTGAASEAEYVELGLSARCDPAKVGAALDDVLGPGLDVVACVEAVPGTPSLTDLLTASAWTISLGEADQTALESAVASLLAADELVVQRMTKTGLRDFDVRGAIVELSVSGPGELSFLGRHAVPLVRPDDVMTALRQLEPALETGRPALLTRLAQGTLGEDGRLADPLA